MRASRWLRHRAQINRTRYAVRLLVSDVLPSLVGSMQMMNDTLRIQSRTMQDRLKFHESADPVHPPMPVGHIRACGCPECVAWLEAHEPADPVRCPKCGGPDPFHDPACVVHPDLIQDHENGSER